jgi:chromosome segregation ATPase
MIDGRKRRVYEKDGGYYIFLTKKTRKPVNEKSIFKEDSPKKTPIKTELNRLMDENKHLAETILQLEENLKEKEQECDSRILDYADRSSSEGEVQVPEIRITPPPLDSERDIQSIMEELSLVKEQRDVLEKQVKSTETIERISILQSRVQSLEAELDRTREEDRNEISRIKDTLFETIGERNLSSERADRLEAELRKKIALIEEVTEEKERIKSAMAQAHESESEYSKSQLKSAFDTIDKLNSKLAELEQEKQRLERELSDAREESRSKIDALEERLVKAEKDRDLFSGRVDSLKSQVEEGRRFAEEVAGEALVRDTRLAEEIEKFEALKAKLEKLEEEKRQVDQKLQDRTFADASLFKQLEAKQREIDDCSIKVDDMRSKLASKTGCDAELVELEEARDQLQQARNKTDSLQLQLGECVQKSFETNKLNKDTIQILEKQFEDAIKELENRLNECRDGSELLRKDAESSSREIASLSDQIKALMADNKQLRRDIQSNTCDVEVSRVRESCESENKKFDKLLKNCSSEKQAIIKREEELDSEYRTVFSQNIELKKEVDRLREKVDELLEKDEQYSIKDKLLVELFEVIKTLDPSTQKEFEKVVLKYSSSSE